MAPVTVTIPNASVPVGKTSVKKPPTKERELSTDAVLRASGVMIVTPDRCVLFLKRASGHDHAGEWCFPGGAIEQGETAELAAIWECREETGHIIDEPIKEIDNEVSPEGVDFTTFVLRANNPFIPELDDEHVGWAWSPIDDPPEPLHPGVANTLKGIIDTDEIEDIIGQDAKSSKETANYVNGPVKQEPCKHCTMFIQSDKCTAVQGEISPTGHCDYFKQSRMAGDIKAANVATPAELRSVIKFPPPKAANAARAVNIEFANGGAGKELQQSTKARRFEARGGVSEHDKGPGPLGHDNEFKESEHPRRDDGKFSIANGPPKHAYHGSGQKFVSGRKTPLYLTSSRGEASGFALGGHLGGEGGDPQVHSFYVSSGEIRDIDAELGKALETDEDFDDVIVRLIKEELAKGDYNGARYLAFEHPSFTGADYFNALISLYPHQDLEHSGTTRLNRERLKFGHDRDVDFKESDHPRAPDGRFGSGGSSKLKSSAKESHEQTKVVDGKRVSANGKPLPAHIASMRIPPAWTDVTYSADPKSALQVTGKDAKGRSQAIYSADFTKGQAAAKFARIKELNAKYDRVSAQNAKAQQSKDPKIKDAADCLALIMKTGIRPGSTAETGGAVKAYGATTLEGKHVVEDDGKVFLRFTGKKGVALNIPVLDETLAKDILKRATKAGPGGKLFPVTSHALLLAHTHTLDGGNFKTKDFRTHIGTSTAFNLVNDHPAPKNEKEYKKAVKDVAKQVSSILGNTPTVALQSYINPTVFAQWRSGIAGSGKNIAKDEKPPQADMPDVHFGDAEKPLPDWRDEEFADINDVDDDEEIETPDDVIDMLGFDPAEADELAEDKEFSEADHPRGQPGNAGQFGSGGAGKSKSTETKKTENEKSSSGKSTTSKYKPGVHAAGLDPADAKKKEWAASSPIKTVDDLLKDAPKYQEKLSSVLGSIADSLGLDFHDPGVKSRERIERKVNVDGKPPNRITDVVRGGVSIDTPEQGDKIVAELAKHFEVADEGWYVTPAGYFDRKAVVRFDNGQVGEVQIWHPDLLRAKEKEGGHRLYVESQQYPIDDPRRKDLDQRMNELYSKVTGSLEPEWKALLGKGGMVTDENLFANSAFDSVLASIPTEAESTRTHSPSRQTHASPGAHKAGSPSHEQNLITFVVSGMTHSLGLKSQYKANGDDFKRIAKDNEFKEADHPRGQPGNAGQFGSSGGSEKAKNPYDVGGAMHARWEQGFKGAQKWQQIPPKFAGYKAYREGFEAAKSSKESKKGQQQELGPEGKLDHEEKKEEAATTISEPENTQEEEKNSENSEAINTVIEGPRNDLLSYVVKGNGANKHKVLMGAQAIPKEHANLIKDIPIISKPTVWSSNEGGREVCGTFRNDSGVLSVNIADKVVGFNSKDVAGTTVHELGHALDYRTGYKIGPQIAKIVAQEASRMSKADRYFCKHYLMNDREMFAEVYRLVYTPSKRGAFGMGQKKAEKLFAKSIEAIKAMKL